jgi:hypothetical protein
MALMAVDDLGEDVGEVGVRVYAAELGGLDQRRDDRRVLAAALGASEQRIFCDRGRSRGLSVRLRWSRSPLRKRSDPPSARARSGSAATTLGACRMRTRNLQRPPSSAVRK